jgi:hypothetical protein
LKSNCILLRLSVNNILLLETIKEGMDTIIPLPDYKIEIPNKKLVKCLELINDYDEGKVSKKKLKDIAIQNKLIREGSREDNRDNEIHGSQ